VTIIELEQNVVYDDAQCAELVSTFCQFFVDKVRRICDNILNTLQSLGRRTFAIRQHLGPELPSFRTSDHRGGSKAAAHHAAQVVTAVSTTEVMRSCLRAVARLANLSLHTGAFPARYKTAQVLPLLKKAEVTSSVSSVFVAGVDLPVAEEMNVLGVVLDQRLTFSTHVSAVARPCNYHARAIRHIRHLVTTDLAQTPWRAV